MLKIDKTNDTIYLTKGDSGTITISLSGTVEEGDKLAFYVRNALNLDDILFSIIEGTEGVGSIEPVTGNNSWTLTIFPDATKDLRRKTYCYDFKLLGAPDENENVRKVITFKGGESNKCNFVIT